jgi:protein O-mannosyl-transferase
LRGEFVLDDLSLPFMKAMRDAPLSAWMSGLRPVLMFTYWLNYRLWGIDPGSYHVLNLVIHFANTGLVFLVLFRILGFAGWKRQRAVSASLLGAAIFAFHPIQTESVSYIAGRSESLASLFMLLAYVAFLFRPNVSISWTRALLVLALFGIAVMAKENAVALAGIFVLTDVFWPKPFSLDGIKRNWRLYSLMAPGAAVALYGVIRVLATAQTAGFNTPAYKWYQYGFTQARALFSYVALAILPINQSIDQDYPPSHTLLEHGAIFYMLALAGMIALCFAWRRRYPLACFGLLMFLTFLAPTSSIIPLDDALVERRMYLALVGLILIGCEVFWRLRLSSTVRICILIVVLATFGTLCYERNRLWGQPNKLLEIAASSAVYNPRPLLNFTEVLIQQGRCDLAPAYLERAERTLPNNYFVHTAWGRTLACLGHPEDALRHLQTAIAIHPCSQVYEWTGLVYGQMGMIDKAGEYLKKAVEADPNSETAHASLALWFEKTNNPGAAEHEYRAAILLDRYDSWARLGFQRVRAESGRRE